MSGGGLNANPEVHAAAETSRSSADAERERDPTARDPLDALEVFDMIRGIKDPEHPHMSTPVRANQVTTTTDALQRQIV